MTGGPLRVFQFKKFNLFNSWHCSSALTFSKIFMSLQWHCRCAIIVALLWQLALAIPWRGSSVAKAISWRYREVAWHVVQAVVIVTQHIHFVGDIIDKKLRTLFSDNCKFTEMLLYCFHIYHNKIICWCYISQLNKHLQTSAFDMTFFCQKVYYT